jgi:hypothetical protein
MPHRGPTKRHPYFTIFLAGVIAGLAGCAGDIDYSPARGIASDIDAVYATGPTSLYPGDNRRDKPNGAYPWRID